VTDVTQPERTRLAWGRTALDLLIVSALFWRWTPTAGRLTLLPFAISAAFAVAISVAQQRRYRRTPLERTRADDTIASVLLTAAAVVSLAVMALVAIATV